MVDLLVQSLPVLGGLIAAAWAFSWFARRQQERGRWFGNPHRANISWLGSYSEAFQRVLDVLPRIGASILNADPNRGTVTAGAEGSFKSLGTTIRVTLTTQESVTFVTVEAGASANPLDWGESRDMIKRFIVEWERLPSPVSD